MKFCSKCGAQIGDGVKFCPGCGEPVAAPEENAAQTQNNAYQDPNAGQAVPGQAAGSNQGKSAEDYIKDFVNTEDKTGEFDSADIEANKGITILSYIWILFLVPWFAAPNSKFARFHAKQGLVLFLYSLIVGVVSTILNSIFGWNILRFIPWIVNSLLSLSVLALMIIGIINVVQGKAKALPVIGKIKI